MSSFHFLHLPRGNIWQTSGVAMGSPISPIVANIFMGNFEKKALDTYPLKPTFWIRFVDNTIDDWPHGDDELKNLLSHLNSMFDEIKFTMEVEENNCIPFLDIFLIRNKDDSIGHKVFRKRCTLIIIFMLIHTTTQLKKWVFFKPSSLEHVEYQMRSTPKRRLRT